MQINNAKDCFECRLGCDPMSYRAQIVSNMDATGWLDAGEYSLFHLCEIVQATLTRASSVARRNRVVFWQCVHPDYFVVYHDRKNDGHPQARTIAPRLSVKYKRTSDIGKLAEIFVVLVISSFALADGPDGFYELYRLNPLDHLETELVLDPEPQWRAMQLSERLKIHFVGEQALRVAEIRNRVTVVVLASSRPSPNE